MKTLKALIIEDNPFMANVLKDMLAIHSKSILVTGIAYSGKEALEMIGNTNPTIVFLDIELPDMTGFEMLQQLPVISFKTIFTTAHSHYAIKAFRFNALDYLVKPIKEVELAEAIKRCVRIETNTLEVQNALANLEVKDVINQKLILPTQQGTLHLVLKHITHIESERNYSCIHITNGKRKLSSKNLAYFEDILTEKGFFRCHRSYLVNRFHIAEIKNNSFMLHNDIEIPISRRKNNEAHLLNNL